MRKRWSKNVSWRTKTKNIRDAFRKAAGVFDRGRAMTMAEIERGLRRQTESK